MGWTTMARRIGAALMALALAASAAPLSAEERLALVIGNGRFDTLLTLPGAADEAAFLADRLDASGYEVRLLTDADLGALTRTVAEFGQRLSGAGSEAVGLVYYAGYGVQFEGVNYLLPTDIDLREMTDLPRLALPAEALVQALAPARTGIVLLDASRTHPFGYLPGASEDGLAEMTPPPGLFLAYAAAPGTVAFRGGAGDSLFAAGLGDSLVQAPAPIAQVFEAIAAQVKALSEGRQEAWFASGLSGDVLFPVPAARASQGPGDDDLWAEIQQTRDLQRIVSFIREHPTSPHIPAAGALLSEVLGGTAAPVTDTATPPAALPADGNQSQGVGAEERKAPVFFGMSLDELLLQSPIVAPIEGLPPELWQAARCSTCHNWTKDDLCTQGLRYQSVEIGTGAIHPLGGAFRSTLKTWAAGGCK